MKTSITFYSDSPVFAAALALLSDGDTKPSRSRSSGGASATESMAAVKKAMAAAKKEHGEDFVLLVLEETGKTTKPEQTIGRQLSACAASNHEAMIEAFEAGPEEEGEAEVDADAVKMAIKAYAKEEGKAAAKKKLKKFDLTLSDLDDLDEEDEDTLAEVMKAFS